MTEMMKNLCRAMAIAQGPDDPDEIMGVAFREEYRGKPFWVIYEPEVRAVLDALKEPSETMTERGWAEHEGCCPDKCDELPRHIFGGMIQAILDEAER